MKFYDIALFMFILQICIALLNATGIFAVAYQPDSGWLAKFQDEQLTDASYVRDDVSSGDDLNWGDFVKGLFLFVEKFALGVFVVPYTLGLFGLAMPYTLYISMVVYFIYFGAIIQMIANRNMKSMK